MGYLAPASPKPCLRRRGVIANTDPRSTNKAARMAIGELKEDGVGRNWLFLASLVGSLDSSRCRHNRPGGEPNDSTNDG
jgi:hypothetical protein